MTHHETTTPRFSPAVAGDPSRASIPFSARLATVGTDAGKASWLNQPEASDLQGYEAHPAAKPHTTHPPIPTPAV